MALAYVQISSQSETLNETLLKQGYAQLYVVPPNDRYEVTFSQAQDQARQAQRGIWGLPKVQQCELADRGNGIGEGSPGCQGQVPRPAPDPGVDKDCGGVSESSGGPGGTGTRPERSPRPRWGRRRRGVRDIS